MQGIQHTKTNIQKKMIKYYYDNRTKILKQHKLKYKMSKNKKKYED